MKKKIFSLLAFASIVFLLSCKSGSSNNPGPAATAAVAANESRDLTGSFSINGKSFTGSVSIQHFPATGQFSVLCESDVASDSRLVQFLFKDESSARAGGKFTVAYDQGKDQTANEAALALDIGFRSDENSGGSITISKSSSGNELDFENISLKNTDKEKMTVSGKIPF